MITYQELEAKFNKARDKNRGARLGNNLRVVKTTIGYGIQHHMTVIIDVRMTERGNTVYKIDNGHWYSITTKKHINNYSPLKVFQSRSVWYVANLSLNSKYFNGIEVNQLGQVRDPNQRQAA